MSDFFQGRKEPGKLQRTLSFSGSHTGRTYSIEDLYETFNMVMKLKINILFVARINKISGIICKYLKMSLLK
jgi:hypothetical protein